MVTGSRDATAQVWDAATGQPVTAALEHDAAVYHASFSTDGRRILTESGDKEEGKTVRTGTARIWDA